MDWTWDDYNRGVRSRSNATRVRPLLTWYRRKQRDLPWRRGRDPYRVWISEIMLQQTTVGTVVPYFERFVKSFPDVRILAAASLDEVLTAWSGLGYYRRARHLHEAARLIVTRHSGRFPSRIEEALRLPGIGRYTAGAILSIAYGRRLPAVDGNVTRVLSRLFLVSGPQTKGSQERVWSLANHLVAGTSDPGAFNQALMELGQLLCRPAAPVCGECPLRGGCRARAAGTQLSVPGPRSRSRPPVVVRADLAVVRKDGRLLLRRRTDRNLMHGLWEFPTFDAGSRRNDLRVRMQRPLATIRHSITFRRLELRVRPATLLSEPPRGRYRWVRAADLRRLPTSSIVRKVVAALFDRPARLC
jgi:A/G-specific adenine glycosylase